MKKTPQDFASLSQRISAYTTRGILCAGVVAAGLVFARQVTLWWRVNVPSAGGTAKDAALNALADPARPHSIAFGDNAGSLNRESFAGDASQAARRLVAMGQAAMASLSTDSTVSLSAAPSLPLAPAERNLLASLADRSPAAEMPGRWRIYELHDAFPLMVGIVRITNGVARPTTVPPAEKDTEKDTEKKLAEEGYRLTLWGIGMPLSATGWTLCVGRPHGVVPDEKPTDSPLPPGCHRTLAIGTAEGSRVMTFTGPARPEAWKQFFSDWNGSHGRKAASGWRQTNGVWSATFVGAGGSTEVRFSRDAAGLLTGFVLMTTLQKQE